MQGKVVTETTTEYKEAATGDDSGFSDFGNPSSFSTSSSSSGPFRNLKSDIKPPESSSSSSEDEDDLEAATIKFQKEALDSHNQCREKHGVAPLKIDKKVRFVFVSPCLVFKFGQKVDSSFYVNMNLKLLMLTKIELSTF